MTTAERMASLPFGDRLYIWCDTHDIGLIYALVTYYTICSLFGFIQGFVLGNWFVNKL